MIGTIAAAGNSTVPLTYSFTDPQPFDGGLYRIIQYDLNGQMKLSPVLKVNCGARENFVVYPNPAHSDLWLSVYTSTNKTALLYMYDPKGSLLKQQVQTLQRGTNLFRLDMAHYPAGNYYLLLQTGVEKRTVQFTKE